MFVRIENKVKSIPSVELFKTLGASSARGIVEKIGQFGSGFLYMLALFARHDLLSSFKLCLGKKVFTFIVKQTPTTTSNGDTFIIDEIVMKEQNGGTYSLNISTQFGAIDWTDIGMGLRELISNGIDGTVENGGKASDTIIEKIEDNQCRAKDNTIRAYIELTPDVEYYISRLEYNFLCLSRFYNPDIKVSVNQDKGAARFYRKGVLVGAFGKESLFSYNTSDLTLKESRNIDPYHARERAAEMIRDSDISIITRFLESFSEHEYWEHDLSHYNLSPSDTDTINKWGKAYINVFGTAILCQSHEESTMVKGKGLPAIVPSEKLYLILSRFNSISIKKASTVLSEDERSGRTIVPTTQAVQDTLDKVWYLIERHSFTNGKVKPIVTCYTEVTKSQGNSLGFYRLGTKEVCILNDIAENPNFMLTQTMIEEVSHYITQAKDCTREFQDFAFRLASILIHNCC